MNIAPVPCENPIYTPIHGELGTQVRLADERVPNIFRGLVGDCCIGTGTLAMASGAILSVGGSVLSFTNVGTATGVASSVAAVAATIGSLGVVTALAGEMAVFVGESIPAEFERVALISGGLAGFSIGGIGGFTAGFTAIGSIIASTLLDGGTGAGVALVSSAAAGGVLITAGGLLVGSGSVVSTARAVMEELIDLEEEDV